MAMTPEESAARELRVPGWDEEEPLYAPGFNPSEQDPNIRAVLNDGAPEPAPTPHVDPELLTIAHEYNFTLPLKKSRAELVTEIKKHAHLDARTNFWNCLSLAVVLIPILSFIAVLVK
jgi:hypothetical protein